MKKQEEKMKKVYLLLLSLVVLMIALTGCGKDTDSAKDNSKPITLRYSTMQNKDHISYQVALNKIVRFTDEEIEMFAEAVRTNVWPQLAKTYGEDFINELLKLYK